MKNLNSTKVNNEVNVFSKDNVTYKEKVVCKIFAEKLDAKKRDMIDINIGQKSSHILEVTCKMEISSIEYISCTHTAPLSSCKKVLSTPKQFRNKMFI